MSARYIPLAVSTTPSRCRRLPRGVDNPLTVSTTSSQCRQRASVSATSSQCRQRASVSATPSQCRQRAPTPVPGECPSPASDCSSEGLCPPRAWGIPSEGGEHHGTPRMPPCPGDALFFVAVGGTKRKMPLASGDCLCPSPRQGNARTRQGWPVLAGDEDAQAGERPHARQGWSPVRLPPGCPPPLGVRAQEP